MHCKTEVTAGMTHKRTTVCLKAMLILQLVSWTINIHSLATGFSRSPRPHAALVHTQQHTCKYLCCHEARCSGQVG